MCSVLATRHLKPGYSCGHICDSKITSPRGHTPHGEEGAPPHKDTMKKRLTVLGLDKEKLLGEQEQTSSFWAPDLEGLRLHASG